MIHDAQVEVTCDGKGCNSSVIVGLSYGYSGAMHTEGRYQDDDAKIEKDLIREHDWIVADGKHYCNAGCALRRVAEPQKARRK